MLRVDDWFCGAGGSTTGAKMVADVEVVHAANHSKLAIETHSTNYPEIEHFLADIPTMDPRKVPPTDVLIASPECKAHSYARGRPKDDPSLFPPGDGLDERSRATMDEVPRFADVRRYKAIIVENVPQLVERCNCGETFRRWLRDMTNLGYEHRKVFLNSAFFPPTPQSRDRIYVVFWRKGQRVPSLDFNPLCWCNECQELTLGVQVPKSHLRKPDPVRLAWGPHDTVWGWYGRQWYFACMRCTQRAVPAITPAATAIEWDRPSVRIGDRERPLAKGTMERIARGLQRLPERPFVVPLHYLTKPASLRARGVEGDVLASLTGQHRSGLVVQVGGPTGQQRNPKFSGDRAQRVTTDNHRALVVSKHEFGGRMSEADAAPLPTTEASGATSAYLLVGAGGPDRKEVHPEDPMHTILTREGDAVLGMPRLVLSNMQGNTPAVDIDEVMGTVTTGNKLYAVDPWLVTLRKNARVRRATDEPLSTVVASGGHLGLLEHRMIVANYGGPASGESQQGWIKDADGNPIGTVTSRDSHAVVEYRGKGKAKRVEEPLSTVATVEQHALAGLLPDIMDCTFRMLEPSEIARGMVMHLNAHGERYVILGNRRDQVKQLGNAVTPPTMTALVTAVRDSLDS